MQHQFLIILGFPPLKLDKVNKFLRSRGVGFIRIPLYLSDFLYILQIVLYTCQKFSTKRILKCHSSEIFIVLKTTWGEGGGGSIEWVNRVGRCQCDVTG